MLKLADDPNVTMTKLADVIATSPELSARMLRIVNSAFYGLPGEVRSIERATTLMGLNSVRNVTIAASLTCVFQGRPLSQNFARSLAQPLGRHRHASHRRHRLAVGRRRSLPGRSAARYRADGGAADHRVKLAAVLSILEAENGQGVLDAEDATYGPRIRGLRRRPPPLLKLPDIFPLVAGTHHNPMAVPGGQRLLPAMVHVADRPSPPARVHSSSTTRHPTCPTMLDVVRLTREQPQTCSP